MPDINPPTGDEEVQKYYGSPYLNEIDDLKVRVANAAANGIDVDVSEDNPLTVAAVAPQLLSEAQQDEVADSTSFGSNPEGVLDPSDGLTFMESNGDEETRVEAALDNDNNIGVNDASATEDSVEDKDEFNFDTEGLQDPEPTDTTSNDDDNDKSDEGFLNK